MQRINKQDKFIMGLSCLFQKGGHHYSNDLDKTDS
jgi:hypothetical protein